MPDEMTTTEQELREVYHRKFDNLKDLLNAGEVQQFREGAPLHASVKSKC